MSTNTIPSPSSHPEIFRNILVHCDDTTLATCLRLSTDSYDIAGPILYRHVAFNRLVRARELFMGVEETPRSRNTRAGQTRRRVKVDLLRHVKAIDTSRIWIDYGPSNVGAGLRVLKMVLRVLKMVETLDAQPYPPYPYHPHFVALLSECYSLLGSMRPKKIVIPGAEVPYLYGMDAVFNSAIDVTIVFDSKFIVHLYADGVALDKRFQWIFKGKQQVRLLFPNANWDMQTHNLPFRHTFFADFITQILSNTRPDQTVSLYLLGNIYFSRSLARPMWADPHPIGTSGEAALQSPSHAFNARLFGDKSSAVAPNIKFKTRADYLLENVADEIGEEGLNLLRLWQEEEAIGRGGYQGLLGNWDLVEIPEVTDNFDDDVASS